MSSIDAYTVAQVRARDAEVIAAGTPGYELMTRAAAAALATLEREWPAARRIAIVCGTGHNAGDGYVLARLAQRAGMTVQVYAVGDPQRLRGDAAQAFEMARAAAVSITTWPESAVKDLMQADLLVDALLGTGLDADVRANYARAIEAINAAARPVLALDVPSGLCADSGVVRGVAVRATVTITFIGIKRGLWLQSGPEYCGRVRLADLEVGMTGAPALQCIGDALRAQALAPRHRDAFKSQSGRVLIVGGREGMAGAVRLAGEAALRVGAGLVTVLTAPASVAAVAARPELMVQGSDAASSCAELAARCDVLVVGPGMGDDDWSQRMCVAALASGRPVLLDAGALRWLAQRPRRAAQEWILTPHPGEAAQLLGFSPNEGARQVQRDRRAALTQLVKDYGGTIVLKGAGTLLGRNAQPTTICLAGNPGMAVPGMGDVLSGAIAGLWAQLRDPWLAARVGVWVHALAGDALAPHGERGLLAGEVATELRHWVNPQVAR